MCTASDLKVSSAIHYWPDCEGGLHLHGYWKYDWRDGYVREI